MVRTNRCCRCMPKELSLKKSCRPNYEAFERLRRRSIADCSTEPGSRGPIKRAKRGCIVSAIGRPEKTAVRREKLSGVTKAPGYLAFCQPWPIVESIPHTDVSEHFESWAQCTSWLWPCRDRMRTRLRAIKEKLQLRMHKPIPVQGKAGTSRTGSSSR